MIVALIVSAAIGEIALIASIFCVDDWEKGYKPCISIAACGVLAAWFFVYMICRGG